MRVCRFITASFSTLLCFELASIPLLPLFYNIVSANTHDVNNNYK